MGDFERIKGDTRNDMMEAQGWIVLWESDESRIVEGFHRSMITGTVIRDGTDWEWGIRVWMLMQGE